MKKYLSLAVSLCALIVGCAKESPASQEGPEANLITVKIGASVQENTKTSIGEKNGDKYPVFWSEGDCIAVNGIASSPAVISNGGRTATFEATVPESAAYKLIYPFTEGNASDEVTFSGLSLPMWTETSDLTEDVVFRPLYSVLKLSVTGDVTLTRLVLTTQNGSQVCGKFSVGEDGTLTPAEPSATTSVIDFGEGIVLSETASDINVPVPACAYDILEIQIFDENGTSMTRKVDGSGLAAGKVKEFPEFEYLVNDHVFAIAGASDLEQFAQLVGDGSFDDLYEGASVVKDFTAPEGWTSIDYSGVFDGGGKTITMSTPLFGELSNASVSNVNIAAAMTCGIEANFGALAKTVSGLSRIEKCSVSGDISISLKDDATTGTFRFAALVGYVQGGVVRNCSSKANVTVNHPGTAAKTVEMGAIAGELASGSRIENCSVTDGLIKSADSNGNNSVIFFMGGIVGMLNTTAVVDGCTLPKKSASSGVVVSGRMDANTYRAGGIAGKGDGVITNCNNAQGVSLSKASQKISYAYIGGVSGSSAGATITDCTNSGTIFIGNASNKTAAQTVQVRVGGIVGTVGTTTIARCTNNASVEYSGDLSKATYFGLGGIAGYADKFVFDGFVNKGKILVHPTAPAVGNSASGKGFQVGVGGLVGMIPSPGTISCVGTPSSNSGAVRIESALAPLTTSNNNFAYVGGCVGLFRGSTATTYTLENTGDVLVGIPVTDADAGTTTYTELPNIAAGGIIGHTSAGSATKATFDGCKVNCKMVDKLTGTTTGPALLCGWAGSNKVFKNCLVAGSVNGTVIDSGNLASFMFLNAAATDGGNNSVWTAE